jgi:integrase
MRIIRRLAPGLFLVSKHLTTVNGIFYYNRKYPEELRHKFGGKVRKKVSLGTRDALMAARKASKMAAEDEALWNAMRGNAELVPLQTKKAAQSLISEYNPTEWKQPYRPGELVTWSKSEVLASLMEDEQDPLYGTDIQKEASRILAGEKSTPFLSEALEVYLREHKNRDDKRFEKDTRLGLQLVFSKLGNRPMDSYTRQEITDWRDELLQATKTATFKRRLNSIKAVFNKGCAEFQLMLPNPFEKLTIRGEGLDSEKREPYTQPELVLIKKAVEAADDDMRWIVGLQIETGARLSEIVGLRSDDVDLTHSIPHLKIRPLLKLGRKLKNRQSERDVPLVGVSLWSAQRALKASPSEWLFPRYASDGNIKATHASNSLVKWLKKTVGRKEGIGNHSFRHTMLDRLRDSGCPEDAAKQIVGHGAQTITRGYGRGYSLEVLKNYLEMVRLPDD